LALEKQKLLTLEAKKAAKEASDLSISNKAKETAAEKARKKTEKEDEAVQKKVEQELKKLKRKIELDSENAIKEQKKKQKRNDRKKGDLFRAEIDQDSDQEISTIEKLKIRVFDEPNKRPVPDEFKDNLVFFHPTKYILDWKLGVNIKNKI
jgi:hypothetical protein